MRYCSTRGGVRGRDFKEVLFSGFAPDGGMFMPETLPVLSPDTLRSWRGLPYPRLVLEVSCLFIPADLIPRDHLQGESCCHGNQVTNQSAACNSAPVSALISEALSGFCVPEVVRVRGLRDGLWVLELFHGSTLAFKDLAMTCTVHFTNYFLQRDNRRAVVLVGKIRVRKPGGLLPVYFLQNKSLDVLNPKSLSVKPAEVLKVRLWF